MITIHIYHCCGWTTYSYSNLFHICNKSTIVSLYLFFSCFVRLLKWQDKLCPIYHVCAILERKWLFICKCDFLFFFNGILCGRLIKWDSKWQEWHELCPLLPKYCSTTWIRSRQFFQRSKLYDQLFVLDWCIRSRVLI